MKGEFSSIWRVGLALVLVLTLGLVMAAPASATHTSTATVAFHAGASQLVGEASALDVVVTNDVGSLGKINEVEIDFSLTDFTNIGAGVEPANWTGVVVDSVITYTAAAGAEIDAATSLTFYPTVINPGTTGPATNPTVTTSDPGTKGTLTTGTGTTEISYVADDVGDGITVEYDDPGAASQSLSVSVSVKAITVSLATDGTLALISTASEVAAAINAHTAASLLVDASSVGSGIVEDSAGPVPLAGGSDPDVDKDCPVTGLLTIKEFAVTAVPDVDMDSSATLTNYTVSFTTLTEIAATTGTITITFPSGYDISLLDDALDFTMTVGGGGYTPSAIDINATARTVTITANGVIAVNKPVEVTTANDHVKNPPTSGTYDIAVLTSGPDEGSGEVTIIPAAFGVVAGVDDTVTAGTAFAVTVSALNADEGSDTGYAGNHFIDFAQVGGTPGTIPAFELIPFTAGIGTSPANFILTVAGETPTITATDEDGITGTSADITINPAVALASFTMSAPPTPVVAGVAFASPAEDITVTAYDAGNNVKTDYVGTVTWTSSDELAELPAAYTFTAEDAGVAVFPGSEFILKTVDGAGSQTITVADEAAEIEAVSDPITVNPAEATAIEIAASVGVIRANDSDTSTITATAVDEFGNKDTSYAAAVTFAASLGTLTGVGDFAAGVASRDLTSTDVGTAIIKVTSGTLPYATTTVKLLADIGVTFITVTVDKTSILNNGVDVRTITATYDVTAADGADYKVTFSTTPEEGVTLSATEVNPVAGVATTTLTTTLATGTIVVTADGIGGLTDDSDAITVAAGTKDISLSQGWNLISLPLIPTDDSVEMVLAGLIDAGTVIQVRAYNASDGTWSIWASTGPYALNPTLTEMEDGPGFWVEMSATGTLTATGCILPAPPETPPTYSIYQGWNMIGFTSLGTGTTAEEYLGTAVTLTLEAMYGYDAATGIYAVIQDTTPFLVPGQGYWLAVSADGTIYP